MEPLLRAIRLSRSTGPFSRLHELSFAIRPGEVVGLAGQSGAGKSTVALLLAGAHAPDAGELFLDGKKLRWPFHARSLGIEVITQQPELAESLDVTRNVFLGNEL